VQVNVRDPCLQDRGLLENLDADHVGDSAHNMLSYAHGVREESGAQGASLLGTEGGLRFV